MAVQLGKFVAVYNPYRQSRHALRVCSLNGVQQREFFSVLDTCAVAFVANGTG